MSLEAKLQHFHHYASNQNLPLEAISVGDEHRILWEMHYAPNAPRNIYSHTKGFTVTAVGLAISDGVLHLDDRLVDAFPDKLPEHPDPRLEKIQLKHLLCMSSGFGKALLMNNHRRPGVGAPDYGAICSANRCSQSQELNSAILPPTASSPGIWWNGRSEHVWVNTCMNEFLRLWIWDGPSGSMTRRDIQTEAAGCTSPAPR